MLASSLSRRNKSARSRKDSEMMMKPRGGRVVVTDHHGSGDGGRGGGLSGIGAGGGNTSSRNSKSDSLAVIGGSGGSGAGGGSLSAGSRGETGSSRESRQSGQLAGSSAASASQQQSTAQAIRKRRSSINVYDQPSSLNSRLRQLETDMLRLDEDRSKLHDDTHAVLAQYELRLSEIHAILKSRQDNVDKYVEDMRSLLQAKEEFEKQTKLLNEKHDRIHEKFMHRETTISREIKLLKNKFELLEKSRQFRSILQKSSSSSQQANDGGADDSLALDASMSGSLATRSDSLFPAEGDEKTRLGGGGGASAASSPQHRRGSKAAKKKSVHIKLSKLNTIGRLMAPLFNIKKSSNRMRRRRSNRVSSIVTPPDGELANNAAAETSTDTTGATAAGQSSLQVDGVASLADNEAATGEAYGAKVSVGAARATKKRGLLKRIMFIR